MRIDVNTFIGSYPFRDIGHWDAPRLLGEMDQCGIDEAWVSHLSAVFWRDPMAGNTALRAACSDQARLRPVPAVHPGLPGWNDVLDEAAALGAPAVRCDPGCYGLAPAGPEMAALVARCGATGMPLMLAVRLEDGRQRHPIDGSTELAPSAVRTLIRRHPALRLIITHAERECIEQVHFGATPDEAARMLWDITWVWGPPEDHLATLLSTVGSERFTFGTGMPLRLGESSIAKLDLLDLSPDVRARIESENLQVFGRTRDR